MMNKRTLWLLVMGLAVFSVIIAGCSSDDTPAEGSVETEASDGQKTGANEGSLGESSEGEVVKLEIQAQNFAFDQEEYSVPLGSTVEITFENKDGYHEAVIDGYDIEITEEDSVTFTADQAGEFEIACSVVCGPMEDHESMKSKLIVTE